MCMLLDILHPRDACMHEQSTIQVVGRCTVTSWRWLCCMRGLTQCLHACARAEMMVKAYMTSYKLPCIITRGNNVYGPHQFPEKLVPKFTLLAKRGEELPVHGGGQVRRPHTVLRPARDSGGTCTTTVGACSTLCQAGTSTDAAGASPAFLFCCCR